MRWLWTLTLVVALAGTLAAQQVTLKNASFEQGLDGWHVRASQKTYKEAPVQAAAPGARGRKSLRVDAANPLTEILVFQTLKLDPGRYEATGSFKTQGVRDGAAAPDCTRLFAAKARPTIDSDVAVNYTVAAGVTLPRGWRRVTVRFRVTGKPMTLRVGLLVVGLKGTAWFDDLAVKRIAPQPLPNDGLWYDDATWLDDGMVTRERFFDMQKTQSPFLERAQRYNDHLVECALLCDDIERLATLRRYADGKIDPDTRARMDRVLATMDKTLRLYTDLYIKRQPGELCGRIDPLLQQVDTELPALKSDVRRRLAECLAPAGLTVVAATDPLKETAAYRLSPNGTPNQVMYGTWGKFQWRELGRRLGVWRLASHCSPFPEVNAEGEYDWSGYAKYREEMKQIGVQYHGMRTWLLSHHNTLGSPAFIKRYGKDMDVFCKTRLRKGGPAKPFNLWNPTVRKMQTDLVTKMARELRDKDCLFYHFTWENRGPMDLPYCDKTPRERASGLARFRAFLKTRHGDIAALNKAWRTRYDSFEAIDPPGAFAKRPNACPLGYEYELWRQDDHVELLRSVYEAWKAADPNTPVLAAHSTLFYSVDPTRVFEAADIMEYHNSWSKFIVGASYLADNAAINGKNLCIFEGWAALQEEATRWGDERAQFTQNTKYAYRLGMWKMLMSFWAFPYTSQASWMWRQGQWSKLATDYATMRWSAAAIPVAKARLRRMENLLLTLRKAPSKVLLVFPRTSWLHQPTGRAVRHETTPLVKLMHANARDFSFRAETRLTAGQENLDDIECILLPWAVHLPKALTEKLIAWTRAGGTLICFGPAGALDEYGFAAGALLKQTLGDAPKPTGNLHASPWAWDFADAAAENPIITKTAGKGRVVFVRREQRELYKETGAAERMLAAINKASTPPVTVTGSPLEVYRLLDEKGAPTLGLLNPDPDEPARATLTIRGDLNRAFDLDFPGGFPIPAKRETEGLRLDIQLAPGGMTLLRLE